MFLKRKLYLNSVVSLLYQIVAVCIGLILPRLFIVSYGSDVNGLVQSITQLLSIISLLDLGVGAVVQAALYRPLLEKDNKKISEIFFSAKKFFSMIAAGLVLYVIALCFYYSGFKSDEFAPIFSITLIIAISISYFAQYYFGMCNTLLLNADQRIYVVTLANFIGLVLNAIITVVLIRCGFSIQLVKLAASLIYLIRPLMMACYVKKHYNLTRPNILPSNAIPNKWSGLAQHIAVVITNSVDNVLLTIFSTFAVVSVYNVYVMPLNSIRSLIDTTSTSFKSYFGNIIAKNDHRTLCNEFDKYEAFMHFVVVLIFGTIAIVLVPFVLVYTKGVTDADYNNKLFGELITIAYAAYAIRVPYTNIIFAAGKFRETQKFSVIECALNIGVSLILVFPFGMVGVAIGTVVSSGYRAVASAIYLQKHILKRKSSTFIKHLTVDVICVTFIALIGNAIKFQMSTLLQWFLGSCVYFIVNTVVCALLFGLAYGKRLNLMRVFKRGE